MMLLVLYGEFFPGIRMLRWTCHISRLPFVFIKKFEVSFCFESELYITFHPLLLSHFVFAGLLLSYVT